jgi:hypothetical protein
MSEEGRVTTERNDQTPFHFTGFPAGLSNVLHLQCYKYIQTQWPYLIMYMNTRQTLFKIQLLHCLVKTLYQVSS